MKNSLLLFLAFFLMQTTISFSQITGIKNVPGDYADLNAAFTALNTQGVGLGGATINVSTAQTAPLNGFQLGSAVLNASLSAANPLVISGNGNTITAYAGTRAGSLTSGANDAFIVLNGIDRTTIQNFVFAELASNTTATLAMENAIAMYNTGTTAGAADGCQYITISGCTFNLNNSATAGGAIYSAPYLFNGTTAATWNVNSSDIHRSIVVQNNTFSNIYSGVVFRGSTAAQGRGYIVNNNTFTGIGGGASTAYGVYTLYIDSLIFNNNTAIGDIAQTSTMYYLFASTNSGGVQQANNNTITMQSGTTTSATYGIYFTSIGANRQINSNVVQFGSFPNLTTGLMYCLYGAYSGGNNNINLEMNNNSCTNQTIPGNGTLYFYYNFGNSSTTASRKVYMNNNIINNITKNGSGTIYCLYPGTADSTFVSSNSVTNFTVTNNTASSASTVYVLYGFGSPIYQRVNNNTINNITVTGTSTSSTSLIRGITSGTVAAGVADVFNNTVSNISFGTGVITGTVIGILANTNTNNIFQNKIFNLTSSQASGLVRGIEVTSGPTTNIYNNFISSLATPQANSNIALAGINIAGGTTSNIYYNTIFPSSGAPLASTGALFGAAGIYYSSTATVTTKAFNNIVSISGTANGDAYISAVKRSGIGTISVKPTNFIANNNIYNAPYVYGEGPTLSTATNVYYIFGGTTGIADPSFNTSCGLYKTFMGETATFNEANLTNLGSNTFAPAGLSYAESSATTAITPAVTTDFNNSPRGSFPDMGALQFTGIANDATGPGIVFTNIPNSICTNQVPLSATITDFNGVNSSAGTKPRVWYKKSSNANTLPGTNTSATNGWKFVEASNNSSPFQFSMDFSLLFGGAPVSGDIIEYFVVAQDMSPAVNVSNNTAIFTTCPATVALSASVFPVSGAKTFTILSNPAAGSVTTISSLSQVCITDNLTLSLGGSPATGAQYQWQSSPAGANTWTSISGATNATYSAIGVNTSTDFRCVISCGGTPIAASPSVPVSVQVFSPNITSTTPATTCNPGPISLTLGASATAGATIKWYDAPIAGNVVGTGPTFNTPLLTSTTNYYVSAAEGGQSGLTIPGDGGWNHVTTLGQFQTTTIASAYMILTVLRPITLTSMDIYPSSVVGTAFTIEARTGSASGTTFATYSGATTVQNVTTPTVPQVVPVNWTLPAGTYYIGFTSNPSSWRSGLVTHSFPWVLPGIASMDFYLTPSYQYFFYNLILSTGCESPRVTVPATLVTSNPTCPSNSTVCITTAPFVLTGGLPAGGTYSGPGVSNGVFSPALAGSGVKTITYTICGLSCTFTIDVKNPPAQIAISETSGVANNDGTICLGATATLTASGGVSYVWSTGATTAAITVNTAGVYSVTVTDATGCQANAATSITVVPNPSVSSILIQPTTCVATNGAVDLTLSPAGNYSYLWSNGSTAQDLTGVDVGTYNVTITNNATLCSFVNAYTLIGPGNCSVCPTVPNLSLAPSPSCANNNVTMSSTFLTDMGVTYGVNFKAFTSPTTDPYTGGTVIGSVSNAQLTSGGTSASAQYNFPTVGTYYIYAVLNPIPTNVNCRPFASATHTVNSVPVVSISVTENSGLQSNDGIICQNTTATLNAAGGGTYVWNTGATTASITVSAAGIYSVTATSPQGCSASNSTSITVIPIPTPAIGISENSGNSLNDGIICEGASAVLSCVTAGSYRWSTGATTSIITVSTAGTYTITVTSANGCTNTASVSIVVNALPVAGITVAESSGTANDNTIIEGDLAVLTATGGGTYRWSTGATTTVITVAPIVTTTYVVTVTNSNGCSSTKSQVITVVPPPCNLACSGNQKVTLAPGECEYQVPNYATSFGRCAVYSIKQIKGPASGSFVKPGDYQFLFHLVRTSSGVIFDSCKFTLSVQGIANPVKSLTCNDNVNITVDENCKVTLNADMFLEGGPYACYWDYKINIWPFNSAVNAINNVPQGVALDIPFGEHTYQIVGSDGTNCWGTFLVEDKSAPVVSCKCVDVTTITTVSSFTGVLNDDSDEMWRVSSVTATACNLSTIANQNETHVNSHPFSVTVSGSYTFTRVYTPTIGSTIFNMYLYEGSFDPSEPCANLLQVTTAASLTRVLDAGKTYILVVGNYNNNEAGNYTVTFSTTTGGVVQIATNPSWLPECQFKCYDLDIVRRETVGMLYNIPGQNANKAKLTIPPTFGDCGNVAVNFEDKITTSECGQSKIVRDWTFTDENGLKSTCSQTFSFNPLKIKDLAPPTADVTLTCGMSGSPENISGYTDIDSRPGTPGAANTGFFADDYTGTPTVVELNEGFVNGYYTYKQIGFDGKLHDQKVDPSRCNIYTTYEDNMFPECSANGCGGNMKILRTWKVFDACTKQRTEYLQVIRTVDTKAPVFEVGDVTVSVSPWGCLADWKVVKPTDLQDDCVTESEIKWGVKVPAGVNIIGALPNITLTGLEIGVYHILYWAEDCCGNYTEKPIALTVIDASAPVAVAKQNLVVSLSGSGTAADGKAELYGWQIDNGSYDHCSDVRFEIRRVNGGSCGNVGADGSHNNNSTFNDNNGVTDNPGSTWVHPGDNRNDTDGGEYVVFCCEDIPAGENFASYDVELRVWDDGNGNGIIGDNLIIEGKRDNYNTTWATVRVENKLAPVLVCPPDVTVTCDAELKLSLDKESPVKGTDLSLTGFPKAYELCSALDVTYKDTWIGNSNPVCNYGQIRRVFTVTKGEVTVTCPQIITVNRVTKPFTVVFPQRGGTNEWGKCSLSLEEIRNGGPGINKPIVDYGQCEIVGENITIDTFLFEDGACKKWRVTYKYINWCTGEEITTINGQPIIHYYTYKDEVAPVLTCSDIMVGANPGTNNPNGGCEGSVVLTASATDDLVCAEESWIKWQGFVDLWSNGTVDRVASSFVNKAWNGIWVRQDKFVAGQLNPNWVAIQTQHQGVLIADVVFVTYLPPSKASGGSVSLPAFILDAENIQHNVTWKITDGCGNVDQCASTIMVVDKKAPTPYCVSLSTALMAGNPKMVELWAKDFDKGAFDNCSPQSKLYFTFRDNGKVTHPVLTRLNDPHFFKGEGLNATSTEYNQGLAYRWLPSSRSAGKIFTSAGDINLDVLVWDEAFNSDFCTVMLKIIDTGSNLITISGSAATEEGRGVEKVQVIANAALPEYPKTVETDGFGAYSFDIIGGANIAAQKDGDDNNGVSTLDLVLIQRHILGLVPFTSPYKMIASDANNDGRVSAGDILEIRKLILGIQEEFKLNSSWRFPLKGQNLTVTTPFPFIEKTETTKDDNNRVIDMVAVKIGDVNGSAVLSSSMSNVEPRSGKSLNLMVEKKTMEAGETVEIPVYASELSMLSGMQFTMNLHGVTFERMIPGKMPLEQSDLGLISKNILTVSFASQQELRLFAEDVLFTVVVKANQDVNAEEAIEISSEITNAEAYFENLTVGSVKLISRAQSTPLIVLRQNEPNPFVHQTVISYDMPVASKVTLTVHDVSGKVVSSRSIDAQKGMNSEVFTRQELGQSGVLYYTLKSGEFTSTLKMIVIE
jgi:hypothetical protein